MKKKPSKRATGGPKSRENFSVGMCLPTCQAPCCRKKFQKGLKKIEGFINAVAEIAQKNPEALDTIKKEKSK